MKVSVVAKVTIKADKSRVFKYLKHLKYHQLWNPHMLQVAPLAMLKPGMEYETTHLFLGIRVKSLNRVLRLIQDKEFVVENSTGILHYHVSYRLSDDEKGTRLICTTDISTNSDAFGFSRPVLKLLAQRELQSDLQALKLAAEQQLE